MTLAQLRIAVISIVFTLAACAQDLASKMDEYLQAHGKLKGFMGAVLVAKEGKIVLEKGYGFVGERIRVREPRIERAEYAGK